MVTVVQGKVCAKNHPDRLSRLATIHQRYRRTDGRTDFLWHRPDLTVGQKLGYAMFRAYVLQLIMITNSAKHINILAVCLTCACRRLRHAPSLRRENLGD